MVSFQEPPEFDQGVTVEDYIRIHHADIFALGGGHPPIDRAPVPDICSSFEIINSRPRLQEFTRSVFGTIIYHSECKRERRLQLVEEACQLTDALEGVVINRDERDVRRHNTNFPFGIGRSSGSPKKTKYTVTLNSLEKKESGSTMLRSPGSQAAE